jgi:GNAT superfamily N-acetyltransferase
MDYREWLGYLASTIVLISLLMSSVKKLRWINLIGSLTFAVYGFLIGAIPVGVMNTGIVIINCYYLFQMYTKNDYFSMIVFESEERYFDYFIKFYQENIKKFILIDEDFNNPKLFKLFVLRNTVPAGIFVGKKISDDTMEVLIDYVTPQYRDFKIGKYLYEAEKDIFLSKGINKLTSHPGTVKHQRYLERMGFVVEYTNGQDIYKKDLK